MRAALLPGTALPRGVIGGFTTRRGGVSRGDYASGNLASHVGDAADDVAANRRQLQASLAATALVIPEQVHGNAVGVVGVAADQPGGCDGLVSRERGIAVAVLVADCLPILVADPVAGVVGVAHAGRRGLATGVIQAVLVSMIELGAVAANAWAVIGPGICAACYEVPGELRHEVAQVVPGTVAVTRAGTPSLDLAAGAAGILRAAGLSRVSIDRRCTAEDTDLFSYRRDGRTGRFAGVVMLSL